MKSKVNNLIARYETRLKALRQHPMGNERAIAELEGIMVELKKITQ